MMLAVSPPFPKEQHAHLLPPSVQPQANNWHILPTQKQNEVVKCHYEFGNLFRPILLIQVGTRERVDVDIETYFWKLRNTSTYRCTNRKFTTQEIHNVVLSWRETLSFECWWGFEGWHLGQRRYDLAGGHCLQRNYGARVHRSFRLRHDAHRFLRAMALVG